MRRPCLLSTFINAKSEDITEYSLILTSLRLKTYDMYTQCSKAEQTQEANKIHSILNATKKIINTNSFEFNSQKQVEKDRNNEFYQHIEKQKNNLRTLDITLFTIEVSIENYTQLLEVLNHIENGLFVISEDPIFESNYSLYIPINTQKISIEQIKCKYLSWIEDYRAIELDQPEADLLWQKKLNNELNDYYAIYGKRSYEKDIFYTNAATCQAVCQLITNRKKPFYTQQRDLYLSERANRKAEKEEIIEFLKTEQQRKSAFAEEIRKSVIETLRTKTGHDLYQFEEINTYFGSYLTAFESGIEIQSAFLNMQQSLLNLTPDTLRWIRDEISKHERITVKSRNKKKTAQKQLKIQKKNAPKEGQKK